MPKLILLRGNSGSGKTTIAKALQRSFGRGTLHLSQDTIRREMLWVKDGVDTAAIPLLIQLLRYGKENAEVTILEGILYAAYYEQLFAAAIDLYGSDIHAYYYDIPFDETLIRHQTRTQSFDFGEPEMRRWWREKDFLHNLPETVLTENDQMMLSLHAYTGTFPEGKEDVQDAGTASSGVRERLLQRSFCRDRLNLDNRIHDAFVEFGKSGRIHTKESTIEGLSRLESDRDIEIRDFSVRMSTRDVAVAQYLSVDRDTGERALRTSVWVRDGTEWKLSIHQGTKTEAQSI